jgi:hypothetical protein
MPNRRPSNTISRPAITWSLFFYLSGDAAGGPRLALADIVLGGQRPLSFILNPRHGTKYSVQSTCFLLVGDDLLACGCVPWICFEAQHAHQQGATMRLLETCAASDMFTAMKRHATQDIHRQQRNMQVTVV